MAELSISEGMPRPLRRFVAAGVCVGLLVALWGWLWVLAVGLGQLFSSTEDGACQQPEYVYGGALIVFAIGGVVAGTFGTRRAARLVLGRVDHVAYACPAAASVLLALAAIATMTVLKPDFMLIPGAC